MPAFYNDRVSRKLTALVYFSLINTNSTIYLETLLNKLPKFSHANSYRHAAVYCTLIAVVSMYFNANSSQKFIFKFT